MDPIHLTVLNERQLKLEDRLAVLEETSKSTSESLAGIRRALDRAQWTTGGAIVALVANAMGLLDALNLFL